MRASILSGSVSETEKAKRIANLTKGEASNIITRLKHGAQVSALHYNCFDYIDPFLQSRYEKKKREATRMAKISSKERLRHAREEVQVGLLPTHIDI
jgi:ATP-dependent helicase IRC3